MTWDTHAIQVIKDLDERKIPKQRASVQLGVHLRTVERKLASYRKHGSTCFVHGNTGKKPVNKINFDQIMEFIVTNKLTGCNFTELCRLLREYGNLQVSSCCVRKRLFLEGIVSVKCKRKTRKKLKVFLKRLKEQEQHITQSNQQMLSALETEDFTGVWNHPTKPRSKYFGERLEMDASSYVWIKGHRRCTLHVCIDDASGFLVGLWLEHEETLNGYYRLMEQVLTHHGVPVKIRTDRRTVFTYNKTGASQPEKDTMTQFAYACHRLGVELGCNSDPDYKPKCERVHQSLQGILPFRFQLEGITNLEAANTFLQEAFIPYFNDLFGYNYDMVAGKKRPITSVFTSCSTQDIQNTLAVLCERTVNKGHTIQLDGRYMALVDQRGKKAALEYHTKLTVARLLDGRVYATHNQLCYALEPVPQRHAFSAEMDYEKPAPPKKPHKRPPVPQSHPWSFQSQMHFKKHNALMKELEPCYKSPHESKYA